MNPSILKELRELVQANVISESTSLSIQEFYKTKKKDSNSFTIILSIIGSVLVALGIVLVVAHNWDDFGRIIKTIFAFLPLILSQVLCFYVIRRKMDSIAWKESAATLLFFSVGTCISLISQIYHISGNLAGYLFVWMFLTVPLMYIFPSFVVSLLYVAGITWYGAVVGYSDHEVPYWLFFFIALLIPAYFRIVKSKQGNNATYIFEWVAGISLAVCLASFGALEGRYPVYFVGYLSLSCLYYLIGTQASYNDRRTLANPFYCLGVLISLTILFIWTFDFLWQGFPYRYMWNSLFGTAFPYITFAFLILIGYISVKRIIKKNPDAPDPISPAVFVFTICIYSFPQQTTIGILLINLWVFLIALYFIRRGVLRAHLGILNFGLLILALLAIFRFFDEEIPFVWRGIIFLLAGAGIFAGNLIIIKRKKSITQNQ